MPQVFHGPIARRSRHPSGNQQYGTPAGPVYPAAEALVDKSGRRICSLPYPVSLPIALALMTPASKSTFVLGHRHLLGIEGLSAADITGLLDLPEEYVELNRPVDKNPPSLIVRTTADLFSK